MSRLRLAALWVGVLICAGCRIEDRTPTGTRRDEDRIQHLISLYARSLSTRDWAGVRSLFWQDGTYAGPIGPGAPTDYHQAVSIDAALRVMDRWLLAAGPRNFDVRVLRTDLRQEGDLAAAWVTTHRRVPAGATSTERDWVEHVVLRRIDGDWRILSIAAVSAPAGSER
jgi:SnoaL-like protein